MILKRRCVDPECDKKFVLSRFEHKLKKELAPIPGDDGLCEPCFADVLQISREQSYFGSIKEWGV